MSVNVKKHKIPLIPRFRFWLSHLIFPMTYTLSDEYVQRFNDDTTGIDFLGGSIGDYNFKPSEAHEYPMLVDTIQVLTDLNAERSKKMSPKDRIAHNQAVIDGLAKAKFLVESMDKWSS